MSSSEFASVKDHGAQVRAKDFYAGAGRPTNNPLQTLEQRDVELARVRQESEEFLARERQQLEQRQAHNQEHQQQRQAQGRDPELGDCGGNEGVGDGGKYLKSTQYPLVMPSLIFRVIIWVKKLLPAFRTVIDSSLQAKQGALHRECVRIENDGGKAYVKWGAICVIDCILNIISPTLKVQSIAAALSIIIGALTISFAKGFGQQLVGALAFAGGVLSFAQARSNCPDP